jgi:hypothetical protein
MNPRFQLLLWVSLAVALAPFVLGGIAVLVDRWHGDL